MEISIVMTTYNSAIYLRETLLSIRNQTYQNYEIVILDDGSTDNTAQIINEFSLDYPEIKIVHYPSMHIGRAAALNKAIQLAKYDWVAILDADDVWSEAKLALQVNYIQKHQLIFLSTQSQTFNLCSQINLKNLDYQNKQIVVKKITLKSMLLGNLICHSSVLAKKDLLIYNIAMKRQVDYERWLTLLTDKVDLYLLDEVLTYHRIHSGQAFESKNQFRYILNTIKLQMKYCLLHKKPLIALLILLKLGYYTFLSKKIRLRLRSFLFSNKSIKAFIYE